MKYDVSLELENREESYSFGDVAKQANGACWIKSGKTVILATVVINETEIVKDDFLPLSFIFTHHSNYTCVCGGGNCLRKCTSTEKHES